MHDVAEREGCGSKGPEQDCKRAQPGSSKLRNMEGNVANEDACSKVKCSKDQLSGVSRSGLGFGKAW